MVAEQILLGNYRIGVHQIEQLFELSMLSGADEMAVHDIIPEAQNMNTPHT